MEKHVKINTCRKSAFVMTVILMIGLFIYAIVMAATIDPIYLLTWLAIPFISFIYCLVFGHADTIAHNK